MSSRRSLILVGAIVVGIFAGVALLNYVRGIEDDIAAEKQSVPVYVATEDIPAGTPAAEAQEFFTIAQVPLELRPNTYLPIDGEEAIAGLVSAGIIPKNQIILSAGQWVNADVVQRSFVDQIPSGQVAVTMQVAQVNAVGGYLQPGDEVNLMVRHAEFGCGAEEEEAEEGTEGEATDGEAIVVTPEEEDEEELYCTYAAPARYLFQRVEILAIGARQSLAPGETQTDVITPQDGAITFAVPNEAAQLLASLEPGDVYLTLLPEDYQAEPLPALTFEDLEGPTPAEIGSCLTPYGPDGFIEGDFDVEPGESGHFRCDGLGVVDGAG